MPPTCSVILKMHLFFYLGPQVTGRSIAAEGASILPLVGKCAIFDVVCEYKNVEGYMEKNFHVPFFPKLPCLHMLFDFKVVESLSRTRSSDSPLPCRRGA
ncbi:hypothetical protein CEXT_451871 [Caerostris extrusa]|uniref:Uncharacterized protein n=1 Tax=Caerostris extrusa TaxID=172846 RepID=A0AAV4PAH6_CAEEX|nr:hypothetical protein CEXT_451871 [Caerostris extrusa]